MYSLRERGAAVAPPKCGTGHSSDCLVVIGNWRTFRQRGRSLLLSLSTSRCVVSLVENRWFDLEQIHVARSLHPSDFLGQLELSRGAGEDNFRSYRNN